MLYKNEYGVTYDSEKFRFFFPKGLVINTKPELLKHIHCGGAYTRSLVSAFNAKYPIISKRWNISYDSIFLGSGASSTVLGTHKTRAVKLTATKCNSTEARIALHLAGFGKVPYTAKVYSVHNLSLEDKLFCITKTERLLGSLSDLCKPTVKHYFTCKSVVNGRQLEFWQIASHFWDHATLFLKKNYGFRDNSYDCGTHNVGVDIYGRLTLYDWGGWFLKDTVPLKKIPILIDR